MFEGMFIIVVSIFLLWGFGAFRKVPNQAKTKGIIEGMKFEEYSSDGGDTLKMYRFYFKYIVDGKEYMIKSRTLSSNTNSIGKKRTIKYNKENPQQAIESIDPFICCLFTFFILVGIYTIYSSLI